MSIALRGTTTVGAVLLLLATAGCSGMNSTQQRTLSGGAAGAAGGALLGALTGGSAALGAAIGGAAGLAGGYLYDQNEKSKHRH